MSKKDHDGMHANPRGQGGVSPLDGKYRGCQGRLRRRAQKAREVGDARVLLGRLPADDPRAPGEVLECGHVGPALPVVTPKDRRFTVRRRCAACRDWEASAAPQIDAVVDALGGRR
jgi:hypothetical protein